MKRALERSPRAMIAQSGRGRPRSAIEFMESPLVLADALTGHEPGRDAFHRVPIFCGEFRDAVECVPTGLEGRFMGSLHSVRGLLLSLPSPRDAVRLRRLTAL